MLDMWGIPGDAQGRATVKFFFNAAGPSIGGDMFQPYEIPRGHSLVFMLGVGGAGGGGGGASRAGAGDGGGGGGAAGGAVTRVLYPRILLPDLVYVQVGCGGNGGAAAATGGNGSNTFVTVLATGSSPAAANILLRAGASTGASPGSGA